MRQGEKCVVVRYLRDHWAATISPPSVSSPIKFFFFAEPSFDRSVAADPILKVTFEFNSEIRDEKGEQKRNVLKG
jgi:hypothetical protein